MRCFERSDLARVSVRDIVGEAGMSSRSFYEFFDSKLDLIEAIVRSATAGFLEAIRRAFREGQSPAEVADRALQAYLEILPVAALELERLGGAEGQRVRAVRAESSQHVVDLVVDRMERLARRGRIRRAPERVEVELLVGGIEALTLRYHREGRGGELAALRPALLRTVLRTLG